MKLTILLFDGFTALDVVGGYEVLARLPGVTVEIAAEKRGLVATDTRALEISAALAWADVRATDILYVPGGPGVERALGDEALRSAVQSLHAKSTWTIGICNGVLLLAAAGILEGKRATTNWSARKELATYGVRVEKERYVRDGRIVTGAGVSASIDAALHLASLIGGDDLAKLIQLGIEYFPKPPYDVASAEDAPEAARAIVRAFNRSATERLGHVPPAGR